MYVQEKADNIFPKEKFNFEFIFSCTLLILTRGNSIYEEPDVIHTKGV